MLSNVRSCNVFRRYCTSIIIVPFEFNSLSMQFAISFSLSECAKTFEAISNGSTRFRVTDTDIQILTAAGSHKVGIGRSDLVAKLDVKNI